MVFTNCGKQATRVNLFLETQFIQMKIFKTSLLVVTLTIVNFVGANAQNITSPDSSHYDRLTADVYKALKNENRKFLDPHIFDVNTFKEIILEVTKDMRNVDTESIQKELQKELSDPKRNAEMTEKLHQNIQEKYHRALAEIAEYESLKISWAHH